MKKTRTQREAPVLNVSKNALGVSQYRVEELNTQIESGNLNVGNNYVTSNLSKRQLKNNESVVATTDAPDVKRGEWVPAGSGGSQMTKRGTGSSGTGSSQLSIGAIAHGGSFTKKASIASSGSGGSSGSNVERLAPEVYSPLFTMANLNLPRDRITVNSWVRNFYKLHPIVRNGINLHATYPISKLNLKCSDRKVLQFFEDMVEEMDLMTTLGDVSLEYWLMGEASLPDSLVTMRDGSVKKIQDVVVGDYVLTHTGNFCKVVKTNSREWNDEYYEICVCDNDLNLQLTGEHPVFSKESDSLNNFEWKHTKDLKEGNVVFKPTGVESEKVSKITKIEKKKYSGQVYDLSVEKDHSYVLNGIVVHNCFPYAELNETSGKWRQVIIQNPDYILVKKSILAMEPIILLRPDKKLQELVMSNNPADMQLRKQIPEKILHHVRNGQSIPLDNFNVTHLKMLSAPYDVYGTSILVSIFKDLMLYDKLRESKFAQADGMVNPITIVKVGGTTDGDYRVA